MAEIVGDPGKRPTSPAVSRPSRSVSGRNRLHAVPYSGRMAESPVELGTVIAGRYRIDRALGAGTMGVVVGAWHLELEQPVAIKFLNRAVLGAAEALERFRREARAAARIKSEHVVRVLDVGALPDGLPFIVMELLNGRSLEDELVARGPLPVWEAVSHVLQAIDALSEAHAAGIVHRDLKPANLFVAERADRSQIVKVLDFGISKFTNDVSGVGLTRTGMIVGSPLYMAPEQLRATKAVDQRADIWALGTILFQLLTARTPYNADSAPDLYAMLLRDPPSLITQFRTDLPEGLESIIMRCLERDPEQRFQNVGELADALLPLAPPASRIHADRARRVLVGVSPTSHGVPAISFAPAASSPAERPPGNEKVSASTDGGGPLIVTNRKTLRSGTEIAPSSHAWLGLGLAGLLLLGGGGYFWAQRGKVSASVDSARAPALSPAAIPTPPDAVPAGPAGLPAAGVQVAADAPVVLPQGSPSESKPTVTPVAPVAGVAKGSSLPATGAVLPNVAAPRAPIVAPKPPPAVSASAAPQPSLRALSNFGGRK